MHFCCNTLRNLIFNLFRKCFQNDFSYFGRIDFRAETYFKYLNVGNFAIAPFFRMKMKKRACKANQTLKGSLCEFFP